MIKQSNKWLLVAGAAALMTAGLAQAKLSDEELAQLGVTGTPLTPMGAIRAGNADGTIPEWSGKFPVPASYVKGGAWVDPYKDDKPLFTITAQNYQQYEKNLTDGQIGMFKQYPETFRMHVYPSHRDMEYEPWVYEATKRQAKNVTICDDYYNGDGRICIANAVNGGGIPFPIPKDGAEAGISHLLAYRGQTVHMWGDGALVDALGNRTDVLYHQREGWVWWADDANLPDNPWFKGNKGGRSLLCDSWQVLQPPRSSGLVFGGCNYVNSIDFEAYVYVPGQRRVRRAPEIGFHDSPSFGSDGQRTVASRWMWWFGGAYPRHEIKLLGRMEKFIPYNNYRFNEDDVDLDDIFGKKHINQDLVRYELHRVWAVRSELKPGERHLYKTHQAYWDEDTWVGAAYEAYDAKDRLWRVGEQFNFNYYDAKVYRDYGDTQIDLVNGRYTTFPGWHNQVARKLGTAYPDIRKVQDVDYDLAIYTPAGLRKFGVR